MQSYQASFQNNQHSLVIGPSAVYLSEKYTFSSLIAKSSEFRVLKESVNVSIETNETETVVVTTTVNEYRDTFVTSVNCSIENSVILLLKMVLRGCNLGFIQRGNCFPSHEHNMMFTTILKQFYEHTEMLDDFHDLQDFDQNGYHVDNMLQLFYKADQEESNYKRICDHYLLYLTMLRFVLVKSDNEDDVKNELMNTTFIHNSKLREVYEQFIRGKDRKLKLDADETKYFTRQELYVIYLSTNQVDKMRKMIRAKKVCK